MRGAEIGVGSGIDIGVPGVIGIISAGLIGLETISGRLLNSTMTHVRVNRSTYLEKCLSFIEVPCLFQRDALHAILTFIS
jgi:hypothetical protein